MADTVAPAPADEEKPVLEAPMSEVLPTAPDIYVAEDNTAEAEAQNNTTPEVTAAPKEKK